MDAGEVDLTDTEFNACKSSSLEDGDANGGGIGTMGGDVLMVNTRFVDTHAFSQQQNAFGGSMAVWSAARVKAFGTIFEHGSATAAASGRVKAFGGCLGVGGGGDAMLRETSMYNCTVITLGGYEALGGGAGIDGAGSMILYNANITSCGAHLQDGANPNDVLVGGGGIGSKDGTLDLQDVMISYSNVTPAHLASGAALLSTSANLAAAVLTVQQDCNSASASMLAAIDGDSPTLGVRDLRYDPTCASSLISNAVLMECGTRSLQACGPSALCSMSNKTISTPICECPPTDSTQPYVKWLPSSSSWSPAVAPYTEGCEEPDLAHWQLNTNWWRMTNATDDLRRCVSDWREGDPTPCLGGSDTSSYCSQGLDGMLCKACVLDDHYYEATTAECIQCSRGLHSVLPVASIVFSCATASSLFLCLLAGRRNPRKKQSRFSLARLAIVAKEAGLVAKVKLITSYYNIVLVIPEAFAITLPEEYYEAMNVVSWINLESGPKDQSSSSELNFFRFECVGNFEVRLQLLSATPIFLLAGVVLGGVLASLLSTWYRNSLTVDVALKATRRGLRSTLPFLLTALFALMSTVSSRIFSTYSCETVGVDDAAGITSSFLYADISVECTGPTYDSLWDTATALIVLWPIGVPVLFACLLAMAHDRPEALALWSAIRFLHAEYRPAYFWWELAELARKLMLTGFIFLIPQDHTFTRLIVAIQVSFLFCLLVACASPYRHRSTTYFASVINFAIGCTMLGALCIKVRAGLDAETALELLGFTSTLPFARIILALNLSLGLIMLVLFQNSTLKRIFLAVDGYAVIQLQDSGQQPELVLAPDKRWFSFISYTKANEETAASIKRLVQLLLPGASIFLDIDDLESREDIEQEVQASAVMLVVQGSLRYTSSAECLRELTVARRSALPLLRVHEWDPGKNGTSMGTLQSSCPEEYRDYLFGSSTVILWHHLKDFQQLALALICEQLLLASPTYSDKITLPLVVPHGLAWATPTIDVQAGLYISPHNPEVRQIAGQLSERFSLTMIDRSTTTYGDLSVRWLLLLTPTAFKKEVGSLLVEELRAALRDGVKPIMLYVPQECTFHEILQVSPQVLIDAGLYSGTPALEWQPGVLRPVSERLVARELGAEFAPRRCRWLRKCLTHKKAKAEQEGLPLPAITWNRSIAPAQSTPSAATHTNEIEMTSMPSPTALDVYPSFQWSSRGTVSTRSKDSSLSSIGKSGTHLDREDSTTSSCASPGRQVHPQI